MHCSGIAQLYCAGRNGNTETQKFDGYIGKLTRSTPSVLNMNYLGLRGGQDFVRVYFVVGVARFIPLLDVGGGVQLLRGMLQGR